MWLAIAANASRQAAYKAMADEMNPRDFVDDLNVISAHSMMADGWFGKRWKTMDDEQRIAWAEANIDDLRRLTSETGHNGLANYGLARPMHLASLDQRRDVQSSIPTRVRGSWDAFLVYRSVSAPASSSSGKVDHQ